MVFFSRYVADLA